MSKINNIKSGFKFPSAILYTKVKPVCPLFESRGSHLSKVISNVRFLFIKNDLKTKITSGSESEIKGNRLASPLQSYFLIRLVRREQNSRGYFCPLVGVFKRGTLTEMSHTLSAFIMWIIRKGGMWNYKLPKNRSINKYSIFIYLYSIVEYKLPKTYF